MACSGYEVVEDENTPGEFEVLKEDEVEFIDEVPARFAKENLPENFDPKKTYAFDGQKLILEEELRHRAEKSLQSTINSKVATQMAAGSPQGVIYIDIKAIIYPRNFSLPGGRATQAEINDRKNAVRETFLGAGSSKGFIQSLEEASNGMFKFKLLPIKVNERNITDLDHQNWGTTRALKRTTIKDMVSSEFSGKLTANFAFLMQSTENGGVTAPFSAWDLGLVVSPGAGWWWSGTMVHEFLHYLDYRLATHGEPGMVHADYVGRKKGDTWPNACILNDSLLNPDGNIDWQKKPFLQNILSLNEDCNGEKIDYCHVKGHLGRFAGDSCSQGKVLNPIVLSSSPNPTPPPQPGPQPPSSAGWQKVANAQIPSNAFVGGKQGTINQYVCRFAINGGTHIGRFVHGLCRVGWGGKAHFRKNFDVLVGNYKWVNGRRPSKAVAGGQESDGRTLYVCQTNHEGNTHIGKTNTSSCAIAWDGKEVNKNSFKYLVPTSGSTPPPNPPKAQGWQKVTNGKIPSGAFVGAKENGQNRYICRVSFKGGIHPGKVVGSVCNFPWGGKEQGLRSFEVLMGQFSWKSKSSGSNGAVVGGNESNGAKIYVCRVSHNGSKHSGKTVGSRCAIGYGGKEVNINNFEYLK